MPAFVNEDVGVPVFPYDLPDRPYTVLGEIKAGVRKATVFSKSPSQEKIYRELRERAEKLGADAVINAKYGDAHVTVTSWGKINATGRRSSSCPPRPTRARLLPPRRVEPSMSLLTLAPLLMLAGGVAAASPQSPDAAAPLAAAARPIAPTLPVGTEVELMVTKEVNSRSAKASDHIKLRVNAPVRAGDQVLIPVGTSAWGEVTAVSGTGAAGRSGRLSMRLLHIDSPSGPVPLTGTSDARGDGNTAGVVLGVLAWGVLGLLNKGDNALIKAGDVIRGYVTAPSPGAAIAP